VLFAFTLILVPGMAAMVVTLTAVVVLAVIVETVIVLMFIHSVSEIVSAVKIIYICFFVFIADFQEIKILD
jgi:hypothetical protein